ncbi:MAG TPA: adenosine deaminase [Thermomicrobiales bacterium]|jgi:adenosine deaminase
MSLVGYLRAVPKAELHIHLEGAIAPTTVLALARERSIALPATDETGLRAWFAYRDFDHFLTVIRAVAQCLRTAADYERVTYELGQTLARQGVRYAEVTLSPSIHALRGVPFDTYFAGMTRGRARAQADFGIEIAWIFSIVRHWADSSMTAPQADYTTAAAIAGRGTGVVALGLAAAEADAPPEPFAPWFARARANGLHSAPHAGETAGPTSIWGAVRALGAERIAHGVRAIDDPALVAYLAEQQITLDIAPTSNICLGLYPQLTAHPLPRLHAAGVALTINTDDPPLFGTTLNDEVALLADPFGLDLAAIDAILLNGVRRSFLPSPRRQAMEADFLAEMARLKAVHLAGD